jgi:ribulose-phosphate 3-epimerase
MIVSPSIASADPLDLRAAVGKVSEGPYQDLHIDIEDGNFIPNITFGLKAVRAMRAITGLPFSFHLMVTDPKRHAEQVVDLGPSIVFGHAEALDYPLEFIRFVQGLGVRCGLAFNPKTPVEPYLYALAEADGALIMTSEPDGRGQQFLPAMLEKAEKLRGLRLPGGLWADGGITPDRLERLEQAGVTHAVMGRAIFG